MTDFADATRATAPAGVSAQAEASGSIARSRGGWLTVAAIACASMAAGAAYTLAVGEDANWDWQNYHEYNVWALLHGRYDIDAIPAGFQTYFNPVIYFPVYALRHLLPAPLGLAIMGAVHGLNLLVVYLLSRVVLRRAATPAALAASLLIAAVGPMTVSEVGTSFSDILTALPIGLGFTLILSAERSPRQRYLWAGLLIGAAVGLKLTNVVFLLGAVAAVAIGASVSGVVSLIVGTTIGGIATGGAWSLMLWQDMGNPVFPLFNGLFSSREMLPNSIMDTEFLPRGLADALAYPFYWVVGDHRSSEFPFRDARFAVVTILLLAAAGLRLFRRAAIFTRRDVQFIVLFVVSYAAWLALFSIQRYAIVLELLCGPLIVLLLTRVMQRIDAARANHASVSAAIIKATVALAIALWSQPGDWLRRSWASPYQPAISMRLAQPATYFLMDKPLGYIAPLLPPRSRFYQLADVALPVLAGGIFDRRIRNGLAAPLPGGIWELQVRDKLIRNDFLARYGLALDASKPCVDIEGAAPDTTVQACPLISRAQ